jgi:hypothetical protein
LTALVWPSSVCSGFPVAASQSRTVMSYEPETTCVPSGEKATDLTPLVWPSSVCSTALQCSCTLGFLSIQGGTLFSNVCRIILVSGEKISAEQYN